MGCGKSKAVQAVQPAPPAPPPPESQPPQEPEPAASENQPEVVCEPEPPPAPPEAPPEPPPEPPALTQADQRVLEPAETLSQSVTMALLMELAARPDLGHLTPAQLTALLSTTDSNAVGHGPGAGTQARLMKLLGHGGDTARGVGGCDTGANSLLLADRGWVGVDTTRIHIGQVVEKGAGSVGGVPAQQPCQQPSGWGGPAATEQQDTSQGGGDSGPLYWVLLAPAWRRSTADLMDLVQGHMQSMEVPGTDVQQLPVWLDLAAGSEAGATLKSRRAALELLVQELQARGALLTLLAMEPAPAAPAAAAQDLPTDSATVLPEHHTASVAHAQGRDDGGVAASLGPAYEPAMLLWRSVHGLHGFQKASFQALNLVHLA